MPTSFALVFAVLTVGRTQVAADLCAVLAELPPRRSLPAAAGGAGDQAEI